MRNLGFKIVREGKQKLLSEFDEAAPYVLHFTSLEQGMKKLKARCYWLTLSMDCVGNNSFIKTTHENTHSMSLGT